MLRQLLVAAGLLQHFTVLAFSDERRVRKPATAMFGWVLDEAATEAAWVVHVGDDAVSDVAGAQRAGMRAIHFVPDPSVPGVAADGAARIRRPACSRRPPRLTDRAGQGPSRHRAGGVNQDVVVAGVRVWRGDA